MDDGLNASEARSLEREVERLRADIDKLVQENVADRDRHRNIVADIEAERDKARAEVSRFSHQAAHLARQHAAAKYEAERLRAEVASLRTERDAARAEIAAAHAEIERLKDAVCHAQSDEIGRLTGELASLRGAPAGLTPEVEAAIGRVNKTARRALNRVSRVAFDRAVATLLATLAKMREATPEGEQGIAIACRGCGELGTTDAGTTAWLCSECSAEGVTHELLDAAESRGLYRKFDVRRTDGSSGPGGKHERCDYYVLDWHHDPFAVPAALAPDGRPAGAYRWRSLPERVDRRRGPDTAPRKRPHTRLTSEQAVTEILEYFGIASEVVYRDDLLAIVRRAASAPLTEAEARAKSTVQRYLDEWPRHGRMVGCSWPATKRALQWFLDLLDGDACGIPTPPWEPANASPGSPETPAPEARPFLILSTKWSTGSNLSWWGPDSCGYTPCIAASCDGWAIAGRYTAEEARGIARPKEGSEPVLLADALALSLTVVPSDSAKVKALTKAGWEALNRSAIQTATVEPATGLDIASAGDAEGMAALVGLDTPTATLPACECDPSLPAGDRCGSGWVRCNAGVRAAEHTKPPVPSPDLDAVASILREVMSPPQTANVEPKCSACDGHEVVRYDGYDSEGWGNEGPCPVCCLADGRPKEGGAK